MAINSLSSSSHGLSGLASGMDTQAMVDAMLKGTQNKIDNARSKKAQLTYKQEMYRSVSAQLRSLKNSFFSFTNGSANNMYSKDFFSTMAAKTSSSAFRVTASTSAAAGNVKVDYIKQLARAKSLKSTNAAAAKLEGLFNVKGLEQAKAAVKSDLVVTVGDTEVKIDDLNALIAGKGNMEAAQLLNDKLAQLLTGTDKSVKVSYENGEMKFAATNAAGEAQKLSISGTGTKIFGAGSYSSADGVISKKATLSTLDPSLFVTLNGVKKSITFDYNKANPTLTDAESVATSLQISLDKAFGPEVKVIANGNKISFETKSTSSTLVLQGSLESMKMLGIKTGQSNKINSTMNVGNINFATELTGNNFQFKINGVDFNITADRTLDNIINQINSSDANVKISYSRSDDKFIIESKQMGEGVDIKMSQSEGNLLSALFGKDAVAGSGATRGDELYSHTSLTGTYNAGGFMQTTDPNDPNSKIPFTGGVMILEVNGKQVGFPLPSEVLKGADNLPILDADGKEQYVPYTAERFKTEMNKQLEEKFGKTDAGTANISFSVEQDASGNDVLKLSSERGYAVGFSNKASAETMGFVEGDVTTKTAKADTKLTDLGLGDDFKMDIKVGGQTITLTKADFGGAGATVQSMTDKINAELRAGETAVQPPRPGTYGTAAFEDPPGRFRLFGVDVPMEIVVTGGENAEALFGGKEISFGNGQATESEFISTTGKNAVLSINGVEVERNSNVFNYDGLDFELLTTTQKMDANGNPITDKFDSANIDVTRDTEKIYNGLVKFVEEYNKVMETINKLLNAEPNYKEYPPLTTEQRSQMSESEAKLWDEKSKEGLLRRDPALEKVMSSLRSVLYSKPGDSDLALYNIGIKTFMSYEPNDSGKLQLDADGATLKKMIAERPDEIEKLFLSSSGGISKGIMDAIDAASYTGTGSQGSLVKIAGSAGSVDTTSSIYKQLKGINESLTNLERTYQSEYTRYWRQFTNMEQMIANMNSQSSWLTQQSGS